MKHQTSVLFLKQGVKFLEKSQNEAKMLMWVEKHTITAQINRISSCSPQTDKGW